MIRKLLAYSPLSDTPENALNANALFEMHMHGAVNNFAVELKFSDRGSLVIVVDNRVIGREFGVIHLTEYPVAQVNVDQHAVTT